MTSTHQMHVVCRQTIGEQADTVALDIFPQCLQVERAIRVGQEDILTVIAPASSVAVRISPD